MKKLLLSLIAVCAVIGAYAESVTVTWQLSDPENLKESTITGSSTVLANLEAVFEMGDKIARTRQLTASGADANYTAVEYNPPFTAFAPTTKVTTKTAGHCVMVTVTPKTGHKFKPTMISFDAARVGTDAGAVDVYYTIGSGSETAIATGIAPQRNKITASNSTGYSHHEFALGDVITDGESFKVLFYLSNINGVDAENPKEIALRNVIVSGAMDEEIAVAGSFIDTFTCRGALSVGNESKLDLADLVAPLKNGESVMYPSKLYGDPKSFSLKTKAGYASSVSYEGHTLTVDITRDADKVITFSVVFKVSNRQPKPAATPLKRGLMAVSLTGAKMGTGNLVSWRHRKSDDYGVKYKLYRGATAQAQTILLNNGLYIIDRTNFLDAAGPSKAYYRLETYDKDGNLLETEVSKPTWDNQLLYIPTETPAARGGATYTPNDASYCDMDGDGEYEIILKWSPSNEKDAASSGATSPCYFDCIKLDGTRLWRIDAGQNFFTSAHTMQFIAWDFDGDGYGEFMMKTAPGTIDGEGNYVIMGDDDPTANLLSSRGKQDHGPEYITVFDGLTGGELATIPYHTDYQAGLSYWGDSNQNRSERYLAGLAYLDGENRNPSPIFARGYYAGAFVGAYDWDGTTLKERWVNRNTTKGQGLWGEGAHWMAVGDCDGDGRQEIVYGSAALDHDGKLLYRTGLGHGDALHLGDFLPNRSGLEVFMVHEESPYGADLRDAATGKLLIHATASGDTGRGIAAHFDSYYDRSQFSHSAEAGMHDCQTGTLYASGWNPGGGGSMNNRLYWDGDLYDEHYDKSCIAKWDHNSSGFGRLQVNKTNYTVGQLNNSTKYNPCVLGDLLGDWREEIVLWDKTTNYLIINATSYESPYRIPHLMDDLNYRVQVVNQNCCYNQPPHLSFDPSVEYANNPNVAQQGDGNQESTGIGNVTVDGQNGEDAIYNLQGIRVSSMSSPGLYIVNGKKVLVK